MGETYTKNTYKDFNKDFSLSSYREVEDQIKRQIEYENLILDHPHDDRVGEILGLIVDVMTSSAEIIRVNREEKPANVVKAQFAKLTKEHVDFVLFRMDSNTTKARNIRAVLLTALYNAVNTMSSYYDNLYQYHIVEEMRGDERKNGCLKKFDKVEVDSVIIGVSIVSRIHGRIFDTFFLEMQMLTLTLFTVWRQDGPAPGAGCGFGSRFWYSFFLTALVIYRGSENPLQDERGFELSDQGTYGTAGFMKEEEQAEILRADKTMDGVNGIIFGRELGTGKVLSLPVDSRLNRNIAVCGSQGSMKSRAFARVMALQCVRRGESMYITDPKSELYEDLCAYLKESGYVVNS